MDKNELLAFIDYVNGVKWAAFGLMSQQITELPPEIGQLVWLRGLILSDNLLTTLPSEITRLKQLQSLDLRVNRLQELPAEIGQLRQLGFLDLGHNRLTELPKKIGQLRQLLTLRLNNNALVSLPEEIGHLTTLRELDLGSNQLMVLPPNIGKLKQLRILRLNHNKIQSLPSEIEQLTSLRELDLRYNQFTDLPPGITQLTSLKRLDLRFTSLPLPIEVLTRIEEPQIIIQAYLDYLTGQARPLNEVKLVIVGQGSVGKTSLVNRLLYNSYAPPDKTEGIDIHHWEIENRRISESTNRQSGNIKVNVWDFGGQEIMHATHQFFLTKRTLYILVLDARLSEVENRLDYWLTIVRSFGGDSPVLIVGNKTDQHSLDLNRRDLLATHSNVQAILDVSCATGDGIYALRETIVQQVAAIPHVNDVLSNTWFDVKARLEALDANYIPYRHYEELCIKQQVYDTNSQRVLLGVLHDLGVVLHFPDPRLETTNILNPEWVTQGVYRILNTRLSFDEQGILTWDMLADILDDESYQEKRMFIVDMMQKFELCYEFPDRPHTYLIPDLLPKETPDTGSWNDALRFEVHYLVLPGSILTRLIVRMHRHIYSTAEGARIAWRTGVLLTCDGNEALVRADLSANRIIIAVRGPGPGRRELLTRIREHLEAIHTSIADLRPAEKVPVPGHPDIPPVDYRWLRKLERRGHQEFIPPGLEDPISVRQLLDGVEPLEARRKGEGHSGDVYHIYRSQIGIAGREASVDDGIHFNKS